MVSDASPPDARARAYHRRRLALSLGELLLTAAYLSVLVQTGAAARLSERVAGWTPRWWLALAVAALVLAGGYRLLSLPLTWLGGYWLPRRYGLLHQPLGRWLWDAAKAALIGGPLGLLAVEIVYGQIRGRLRSR